MTIRLYLDDDSLDKVLVKALRDNTIDVVTTREARMAGRDDEEHLAYAAERGRVLCSFNTRDFCRIHRDWMDQNRSHSGIILAQQRRYSPGEQMRRILRIVLSLSADDMKDRVEFLTSWG